MTNLSEFELKFLRLEKHLLLPNVTAIITTQHLYDILFQYCITVEKEQKLQHFINMMEKHIKSKSKAPFSMPYSELAFLEEGLEELKLLNWMEADIALFEIKVYNLEKSSSEYIENIVEVLNNYLICKQIDDSNLIYVYPNWITKY
ncbi:hypothetical protein [Thermosyntropha sp.]|uniref:hypothetical protein n=1 Tax=Thermosyntropha sp. TaxID=2740820 RepID=UPI0025E7434B|nr:hypothetical protein [Thermosyntropha sp.]MBO8159093.1 hypothetical protein [Thermosyntropha sp.]